MDVRVLVQIKQSSPVGKTRGQIMNVDTALLIKQPFLKGLRERQLETLLEDTMPATFRADEVICKEGSPANRFYLLLSGEVAVESCSSEYGDERKPVSIETIGEGDVLGWSWMFPPYYWHFDARATSPVNAIFFYGTRLRERCEKDHELGFELMKRVAEVAIRRLHATRRRLLEAKNIPQSS
jgi:CRP-like cAMP-binding protein